MLQLSINRKPYMGSLRAPIDLTLSDLEGSESRSLCFLVEGDLHGIDIFVIRNIKTFNLDFTKCSLLAGGVFRCPSGLSCINDCHYFSLSSAQVMDIQWSTVMSCHSDMIWIFLIKINKPEEWVSDGANTFI